MSFVNCSHENFCAPVKINAGMSSGNVAFLVNSLGRQMLMDSVSDERGLNVFIIHALVLASSLTRDGTDVLELIRTVLAIVTVHKDVRQTCLKFFFF